MTAVKPDTNGAGFQVRTKEEAYAAAGVVVALVLTRYPAVPGLEGIAVRLA